MLKTKLRPGIAGGFIVAASLLAMVIFSVAVCRAEEVKSITIRGQKIALHDTEQKVATILKESELVSQIVRPDPKVPSVEVLVKHYKVLSKKFTLYFAKVRAPGPYRVVRIVTEKD